MTRAWRRVCVFFGWCSDDVLDMLVGEDEDDSEDGDPLDELGEGD